MNTTTPSFVYDATNILGIGAASVEPLPDAAPGEVVVRYGDWSLQDLRDSEVGKKLMHRQDWYNRYPWSSEKLPAGIYRLRIPVADSNCKTFVEQERMLPEGEHVAPVVLIATTLLAHRLQTGEDLLKNDWTRCKEKVAIGGRVVLDWRDGRLDVISDWGNRRFDGVWVSSVRTS